MSHDDPETTPTGAEGQASRNSKVPFQPSADDETPMGSTDQHSQVPSHGSTPEQDKAHEHDSPSAD